MIMEDLEPFDTDGFDEGKCFQNLLLRYESKYGVQALEFLQRDLSISSEEMKTKIVSVVRTDFDALARAPLEMLQLDDCVQRIEDRAQELQIFSASSLDKINTARSNIDGILEDFRQFHLQRSHADAELQRVMWLHDLGAALSRHDLFCQPDMDRDAADDAAAGDCLHLCALARAVGSSSNSENSRACGNSEVDDAAAAAVLAVQGVVLPRIKDALHRLHRVPSYVRCICLFAHKDLVVSTISDSITLPVISRLFSRAASSQGSAAALLQLFTDLETEWCQLLQLLQHPRILLSNNQEIDASVELLLSQFFARLLKSEFCSDFVQVDTVVDRYFSYMSGLQLLARSSACAVSVDARIFLQQQHANSPAVWALPLRALSQVRNLPLLLQQHIIFPLVLLKVTYPLLQSRLSRIRSVLTPRLIGDVSAEPTAISSDIEQAAVVCGVRTSAAAAAAWAIGAALPSVQQPPPLLPRAIQLLCVVLANFGSWVKALALAAVRLPQDGSTRTSQPPLSLLLRTCADISALAKVASATVNFHCTSSDATLIDAALAPTLTSLSSNGSNLYAAAAKLCSSQLSELMVSVRSIAISFRQSSRPYPTTASAYVELQQQLLQQFADDAKTSGLTHSEQCEWLREVCDVASGGWAACVDDILTTARRQNAFARKSRDHACGDLSAPAAGSGATDALSKMEQQVRLDLEEVCRGWANLGLFTDNMTGIVQLRACLSNHVHVQ